MSGKVKMKNIVFKVCSALAVMFFAASLVSAQKNKGSETIDPRNHNIVLKNHVQPELTGKARKKGMHGTLRLKVAFLAEGKIGDVIVIGEYPVDSWNAVDMIESAIRAAKRMKFEPAVKDGVPITVYKVVEFRNDVP
jgi:TonB family protein